MGVKSVGLRNLLVRGIGFAGTIALARLLTPADFGFIAIGLTVVTLGHLLSNGGLGAQLLQRETPPQRLELESLQGFQLLITGTLAAVLLPIGIAVGEAGLVAAIMACSLPLAVLRTPTTIVLERNLDWRLLAAADVVQTLVYNGGAILFAALGFGPEGVAVAVVAQAATGTTLVIARGPLGLVRPRVRWGVLRPLLRVGVQFQAVSVVGAIRDQGLIATIAAVADAATLGIWTLAFRVLQPIMLLLEALRRVAFPAYSRMLQTGEDAGALVNRALQLTALAIGAVVVVVAGTAPALVPVVFGPRWVDATEVLPWGAAALLVSGPASTSMMGFLQARGDMGKVLQIIVVQAAVWVPVTAVLVPVMGVGGAGVGMFLAALTVAFQVVRATRAYIEVSVVSTILVPSLTAVIAAGAGWLVAEEVGPNAAGLALSLVTSLALYGSLVFTLRREHVRTLVRMARQRGTPEPQPSS